MSGIQKEVMNRPASTEEDGVWAWVFRECEDCDGEWMQWIVVMNRRAAVEGGAEGDEERIGERKEEDSTQMGGEELEVDSWVCCCLDSPGCCLDCYLVYSVVHSQPPDLLHFEEVFERYGDLGRHDGVGCSRESL